MLGIERRDAARFSMLLSIPVIAGAGVLEAREVAVAGDPLLTGDAITVAALSFLAALATIWALLRWLQNASFTPLVVYRLALGLVLLGLVYL